MSIDEQLRRAVKASGLTNYRISKLSGLHPSTVGRFMAGHSLTPDNAERLAGALGMELVPPKLRQRTRRKANE